MNKWKAQSLPSVGARKQGEQRQCENEKTHARRPFLASEMALERREVPRPLIPPSPF